MALTLSLSLSINTHHNHRHYLTSKPHYHHHHQILSPTPKPHRLKPINSSSSEPQQLLSFSPDPLKPTRFLTSPELDSLKLLEGFAYTQELESGSLSIRAMRDEEREKAVALLAESFAESMVLPGAYNSLLRFLINQYLMERRAVIPHAITLLGFFRERKEESNGDGIEEMDLAGTVEVCFDRRGANVSPPTPTAPRDSPYISNMTVRQELRRRGIGWHLLKASEELISQIRPSSEVYLHCRIIDFVPFDMYTKAGYRVVMTDNLLILLTLQRRKHLMCKELPVQESPLDSDALVCDDGELT